MKRSALLFLHLTVLVSGCVSDTGYLVHFRSQEPFRPGDPNELLAELTGGLPAGIEIQQFLYHRRPDEMRGVVLVRGARARDAVRDAIHGNPSRPLRRPMRTKCWPNCAGVFRPASSPPSLRPNVPRAQ
jgi:hypothetical protein